MQKNLNNNNKTKNEEENNRKEGINMSEENSKLITSELSKVMKENNKHGEIANKYKYINEQGEIIYEIYRMKNAEDPFYVVRPLDNGGYKYGLGKVKTIPYNLPNVITAKKNKEIIIITEGESKADVLNELGYTATTAPFKGTDKWNSRYNKYIKYANILLIADNDDKGRKFANTTFDTISDVVNAVGILELSNICPSLGEGGDIEDVRNIANNDTQLKQILDLAINDFMSDENKNNLEAK